MSRLLKGLVALLALAALCLGAPALLVALGTLDFSGLATPGSPDDGSLLVSMVTAAGWAAWLSIVVEVATDLASGLSRGRFRWRPTTGAWIRPLTSALVAAVLATSLARTGSPEPDATTVPVSSAAVMNPQRSRADTLPATPPTRVHVVQPGEDWWAIAAQVLGDGAQWRTIAEQNPRLAGDILTPGMDVLVPAAPAAHEAPPPTPARESTAGFRLVTVVAGDSLWTLAQRWLGDGHRWPQIAAANPELISDPDQIEIGWVLKIPSPATRTVTADQAPGRPVGELPEPAAADTRRSEPASTPATPPAVSQPDTPDGATTTDPVRLVAGGITAALAAGIGAGLALRRRQQLASRALGRRVAHPGPDATRFATALGRLSTQAQPLCPTPTSVLVGEHEGRSVLVDLGAQQLTAVVAEPGLAVDLIGGMTTSLVCADWSADVLVTVVSEPLAWAAAFDHPALTVVASADEAISSWAATARRRHEHSSADDDSPSEVYLFCEELPSSQLRQLASTGHPKMHAVVAQQTAAAAETLAVTAQDGTVWSSGQHFVPQLLGEPARRALVELHETTDPSATAPAPWWFEPPDRVDPPTPLISLERPVLPPSTPHHDYEGVTVTEAPHLLLLGPIHLVGARGPAPARAAKQLIEYCAWIHENPGRSSPQMTASLLIAESTRRSNMSRLRAWLGTSPDGEPYLPEAYTGRIALHPAVSSDWEMLRLKLAGGVNRAPSQALVDGLTLVRGAPLADAAPGQWHWAEELRSDMISTIRDMAVVLGRRALQISDLDTARWAVHRGLQAAPDDELLMGVKIRCEHLAGNRREVERMVLQVTRQARLVGSDLHEETVALLQQVMEGRTRSRRA